MPGHTTTAGCCPSWFFDNILTCNLLSAQSVVAGKVILTAMSLSTTCSSDNEELYTHSEEEESDDASMTDREKTLARGLDEAMETIKKLSRSNKAHRKEADKMTKTCEDLQRGSRKSLCCELNSEQISTVLIAVRKQNFLQYSFCKCAYIP